MKKFHSALHINKLALDVHLGFMLEERKDLQNIFVDLKIIFAQAPNACLNDDMNDTVCYATFIAKLKDALQGKFFHLIEHLTHFIYQIIKAELPPDAKLRVSLHKYPKLAGLTQGVSFVLDDTA